MATNKVRKKIYTSTNFVVPAGVTRLRVVGENTSFKKISAGSGKTAQIIDGDKAMWFRGENLNGQGGNSSVTYSSTPSLVSGTKKWQDIKHCGGPDQYFFGIDVDGNLFAWGSNSDFSATGFLGVGSVTTAFSTPTLVAGSKRWRGVFIPQANGPTFWGIDVDGNLWGWGANSPMFGGKGLVGSGDPATAVISTPVLVAGSHKARYVGENAIGPTFFIDDAGNAWGWGSNICSVGAFPDQVAYGAALGNSGSNTLVTSTPTLVLGNHKWKKLVTGVAIDTGFGIPLGPYTLGITDDGKLWGWGGAAQSIYCNGLDVGGDAIPVQSTPVLVNGQGSRKYVDLVMTLDASFGNSYNHALDSDGNIYSWGFAFPTLGLGLQSGGTNVSTPTLVNAGGAKFSKLFAPKLNGNTGSAILFALDTSGNLWNIGYGGSTVMGTNDADGANCSTPRMVIGSRKWVDLAISCADWTSMYGVTRDGDMLFWGTLADGNSSGFTRSSPTLMEGSHVIDPRQPQESFEVDVVPGETVSIEMSGALAAVKGQPFAKIPSRILIEYES